MSNLKPISILENRFGRVLEAAAIKNAIREALRGSDVDPEKEKTIITIAEEIGQPKQVVHWYLTSMSKYSIAMETSNREGQYHKWALVTRVPS